MTSLRQSPTPVPRPASPDDVPAIATALASAFADDPLMHWFLGRRAARAEENLRSIFGAMVRTSLRHPDHLVHVTADGSAVALWKGVEQWKVAPSDLLRTLPGMLASFGPRSLVVLRALAAVERAHPEAPHYYLEVLGTRADRQGHGHGSAVLVPVLDRCDEEGLPAYLESSNPRNLPFYRRHGFVERPALDLPGGAPPITPMWREPR